MAEEVLKALANRTNQGILGLLSVEPTYPRRIGDLLSLSEAEVARRLKHMEGLGLVAGEWRYLPAPAGRAGKNVKLYRLTAASVSLRFTPEGLRIDLAGPDGGAGRSALVNPFVSGIPSAGSFIGREKELATVGGAASVVVLEGMPGIGKTSLAAKYAQSQAGSRAVFWHSFRGVESLPWLANRLGVFLAQQGNRSLLTAIEQGAELADRAQLLLHGIDDPRLLVVLDDVHAVEDEAVRTFVTDLIQGVTQGKLLVVTRERPRYRPTLPHVALLRLGGLADGDVTRFLEEKGVHIDAALLPKVREELGGHPLALNLFLEAAREMNTPVERLLDRIPERNLEEYLLQEVYATLTDDEKHALGFASLFRGAFELEDMAALARKDPEPALFHLRKRLLLEATEEGYGLHEIVRNFFYNLLKDKKGLHAKVGQHYLSKGTIEGRLEAMHHFLAADRRDRVLALLEEDLDLKEFDIIDAGYHNLYLGILEMFQRAEVKDPRRWALIEDEKGDIRFHRGDWKVALEHYDAALAHFAKADDAERVADLSWKRSMAFARLGKGREAAKALEEGLKVAPAGTVERERLEEWRSVVGEARPKARTVKKKR